MGEVLRWLETHGRMPTPSVTTTVDGKRYPLGAFTRLMLQRREQLEGTPRVADLEAVPGWTWSPRAQRWNEVYREVAERVQQGGALEERHLSWLRHQVTAERAGRLTRDQQQQLEGLFGARLWDRDLEARARTFAEVLARYAEGGTDLSRVPYRAGILHEGRRYPVGRRLSVYRSQYRAGLLSPTVTAILESVPGWTWRSAPPGVRARSGHPSAEG